MCNSANGKKERETSLSENDMTARTRTYGGPLQRLNRETSLSRKRESCSAVAQDECNTMRRKRTPTRVRSANGASPAGRRDGRPIGEKKAGLKTEGLGMPGGRGGTVILRPATRGWGKCAGATARIPVCPPLPMHLHVHPVRSASCTRSVLASPFPPPLLPSPPSPSSIFHRSSFFFFLPFFFLSSENAQKFSREYRYLEARIVCERDFQYCKISRWSVFQGK